MEMKSEILGISFNHSLANINNNLPWPLANLCIQIVDIDHFVYEEAPSENINVVDNDHQAADDTGRYIIFEEGIHISQLTYIVKK